MSINPVQHAASAGTGAGGTTITVSLAGVAAGNLLTLQVNFSEGSGGSSAAAVITDSNGTWTAANAPNGSTSGVHRLNAGIFQCPNAAAGTHNITVTAPSAVAFAFAHATLAEWSGIAAATPVDVTGTNVQTSGTQSNTVTASAGTAQPQELVLVAGTMWSTAGKANEGITDPPSGYTSLYINQNGSTDLCGEFAYQILAATGTPSAAWSWGDANTVQSIGLLASFKAAASGNTYTFSAGTCAAAAAVVQSIDAHAGPVFTLVALPVSADGSFPASAADLQLTASPPLGAVAIETIVTPTSVSSAITSTCGAIDIYDNGNGSIQVAWPPFGGSTPDGYNVYLNGVLNQQVTQRRCTITGLTQPSYVNGVLTPPVTYAVKIVATRVGVEVSASLTRLVTAQPDSIQLTTAMRRPFPFPNTAPGG